MVYPFLNDYPVDDGSCSPSYGNGGLKNSPWLTWEEWDRVRVSLFSSSPQYALQKVEVWRGSECLPLIIDITAAFVEIQQIDHYFRADTSKKDALESEEILKMLYSMAFVRLVNGVIEKTREKTKVSIGEAAEKINIPRKLIDIRHECSHRDLPSLPYLRPASVQALDWLRSYYWEPQKKAIQFESERASGIRKEINSRLCELAFSLSMKQVERSSSPVKRKWIQPCAQSKFLSHMTGKEDSSKYTGSKKQISYAMKNLLRTYSSHSSQVASVIVELLLKESGSSPDFLCPDDDTADPNQSIYDQWKPAITKLSNKNPEFLLTLIKTVSKMIETQEPMMPLKDTAQENSVERLSDLFAWLIIILNGLKPVGKRQSPGEKANIPEACLPRPTLIKLLRRTLLVSWAGKSQLKSSTLVLANMVGNKSLVEKLNKLFLLPTLKHEDIEESSCILSSDIVFTQQEDYIIEAVKKLELLKHRKEKTKIAWDWYKELNPYHPLPLGTLVPKTDDDQVSASSENKEQCFLVERSLKRTRDWDVELLDEFSGKRARENGKTNLKEEAWDWSKELKPYRQLPLGTLVPKTDDDQVSASSENNEQCFLVERSLKRTSDWDVELLDEFSGKRARENGKTNLKEEGVQGMLMLGGVWKNVEQQELLAIAAGVKVLV